ncbi:MAG TPA: glycogen synthase GlgA [Peptococcaceae bacterium]|nr:glycogen synthase GlgA [Clostridia bacterium]HOB82118.1 glycogen synthase GlgA [Peptococcaceae bacterium]HPZ70953.1 glycogen synthase GlgA [Peptococcaceae bacterium]HQD54025.1 glycogen synthase GlgA [Peptococcaceae bacterium]
MKVLYVASECAPFAITGGLGDVIESLPRAIQKKKVDARVILPKYGNIPAEYKKEMMHVKSFTVPVGWRNQYAGLQVFEHQGITYYFIDNEGYFKREGIYGYFDEAERFSFFCRAVLESLQYMDDFQPDILHCNDWQTALVPVFLKEFYWDKPLYQKIKTVFTIHNLKYQGVFWMNVEDVLGLSSSKQYDEAFEFYGDINFMKAGIYYADKITTVSNTYAEEIKTAYFGENLDGVLRKFGDKLVGIINGIDYNKYNPESDPHIYANYRTSLAKKEQNKLMLQEDMGLPVRNNVPMLGMVSRLTRQKGLDLLVYIIDELLSLDVQLVILGVGEYGYEHTLRYAAERHPAKMQLFLMFNEAMARKIYAASDLYLMPSLFEPCGLSHLIALRYGTLPVVRETGGLKDTIQSYNECTGEGNGFSFTNFNAHDFLFTIKRALDFYHNQPVIWNNIVKNAFKANYSWHTSAQRYIDLYESLLSD